MSVTEHHENRSFWRTIPTLKWGVLFVAPDLNVECENELGARLFNAPFEQGRRVPLSDYLPVETSAYQLICHAINTRTELNNDLILWETSAQMRHILLDSYSLWESDGSFAGMHFLAKDLGDFAVANKQLQIEDRLHTISKVAAGVAHEIRNPLTTVKGFIQMLNKHMEARGQKHLPAKGDQTYLGMVLSEIERMESIVTNLLMLANPQYPHKQNIRVPDFLDGILPAIKQQIGHRPIAFSYECLTDAVVRVDTEMMTHAILNIVHNALEAMSDKHEDPQNTVHPSLKMQASVYSNGVVIDIVDTGPGIPYYEIDKIFDAFFTTKESSMGLGLPISQKIVDDHGGTITVSSKGFGTTFHVFLPHAEDYISELSGWSGLQRA